MLKGIDVSYANGTIDWSKAKKSINFAIIRSTFGSDLPSQTDSFFTMNADGCVKNNIPFGTYHFAYFVDKKTAEDQANFAIRKANLYKNYVKFIALDIEEDSVQYAKRVGKYPNWTECALVFLKKIQSAGYTPVLYTNYNWIMNVFDYEKLKQYKLWYAAPGASAPKFNPTIWQYNWEGKVPGLNGDVDMDYLYDETLIKKSTTTTTTSTVTPVISSPRTSTSIDVTYQVYADGRWLPAVKNLEDYAGLENKKIQGIYMKPSKGNLRYRVKLIGSQNYLPWVIDRNDYAGILGKDIDCVQVELINCPGYNVQYRVSTINSQNYLPWVTNYNTTNSDGYAGVKNKPIDKLQIKIVKK